MVPSKNINFWLYKKEIKESRWKKLSKREREAEKEKRDREREKVREKVRM